MAAADLDLSSERADCACHHGLDSIGANMGLLSNNSSDHDDAHDDNDDAD